MRTEMVRAANGHGTTRAQSVLLGYLVIAGVVLIFLDRRRTEERVATEAPEATAVTVPIGAPR
jgi:hypothetical protein